MHTERQAAAVSANLRRANAARINRRLRLQHMAGMLKAEGRRNAVIAARLGIGVRTVGRMLAARKPALRAVKKNDDLT